MNPHLPTMTSIIRLMREKNSFLVTAHEKQDGDAAGSCVAVYHLLKSLNKEVRVFVDTPPRPYRFLYEGVHWYDNRELPNNQADVIIVLDCADQSRIGISALPEGPVVVNIDHHHSNTNFGAFNLVAEKLSSAGEIVYVLAREAGFAITPPVASALYAAIVTDTGRFTHKNTEPRVLRVAADLIELGADPTLIAHEIWENKTFAELSLITRAMQNIERSPDGNVAWTTLLEHDYIETGANPLDTQEFVNLPRALEGAKIAIFFTELPGKEKVKASIRTTDHVDANKLAKRFGGGGHYRAAGCQHAKPLQRFKEQLLAAAIEEIQKSNNEV